MLASDKSTRNVKFRKSTNSKNKQGDYINIFSLFVLLCIKRTLFSNIKAMELIVFVLGGVFYGFTEFIYRGYTHWTMVLTGGAVILTFYLLVPFLFNMNVFLAATAGAVIITAYEFSMGVVVNLWMHWDVWDYSARPGNILGQICPLYTVYWFTICLAFFSLIKYNMSIRYFF